MCSKTCFYAKSTWRDKNGYRREEGIVFSLPDEEMPNNFLYSVKAAWRWVEDRKKQLPDDYAEIETLKIGTYRIGKVDSRGYCQSQRYHDEYKWDNTMPEEDFKTGCNFLVH